MSETDLDSFPELSYLNAILSAIRNVNQIIVSEKDRAQLIRKSCKMLIETEGAYLGPAARHQRTERGGIRPS